jgi:antirestriction protein ArdC
MPYTTEGKRDRRDLYGEVTAKILAQLESGVIPWVQPWKNNGRGTRNIALPHNAATSRAYSGINIPLLWLAGDAYGSDGWLTFKQALALGGNVRAGEKGAMVVYADKFIPKDKKDEEKARPVWFLKAYTVFNVEQCEGLPNQPVAVAKGLPELHAEADTLVLATKARIAIGGDKAAYWPDRDLITVPAPAAYEPDGINWYRTAFHELAHWTGAGHRLKRDFPGRFGNEAYAREELVAEMSAAFTCATLGIVPTVRHADYIGLWIKVLRGDKRAIVQAASLASKASDFVLAFRDVDAVEMKHAA